MKSPVLLVVAIAMALGVGRLSGATHLMENLGRGVVAVRASETENFVSWRFLGTDPDGVAFNLYRAADGGAAVLLNAAPLTGATEFSDTTANAAQANAYFVRPIIGGVEGAPSASFAIAAAAPVQPYLRLPLQVPAPGPDYTYSPNDASVGDLDGDGEYEIVVKWDPSNSQDNSFDGVTGNVYLDAYRLDGTQLWRIDLGRNIRAGAHYTQFMVYDLDGDGKAEIACKTGDGTISGTGEVIGNGAANHVNANGRILSGPEYLTIFNGETGAVLKTVDYNPPRGNVADWGDTSGNRVERYLAGIAYLDGRRPSLIMCRGYYTRAVIVAYDWRDGQLTQRWIFDTGNEGTASPLAAWRGQGAHSLTVGDVDGDGRDEITYGAAAIDDDGTGLYSTGLGHGDALHLSDMDPSRPGQEVWMAHESPSSFGPNGLEFRDARTGELVFGIPSSNDVGRGVAGDIDPRYVGYEMWGPRGNLMSTQGVQIVASRPGQMNFMSWWDGDLLRELLDGTTISKWDWENNVVNTVLSPPDTASNNSTKANPALSGDILGDWREELMLREAGNTALRIYTTTIPTAIRLRTLMHDRQYREAIAWQNVGYNQPPHPSFYLGEGMATQPAPDIVTSLAALGAQAPAVVSINRYDPATSGTGATSVVFRVTFSTPVTGVDAADFAVATTNGVTGAVSTVVQHSAYAYNVTVTGINGTGSVRLDVAAGATITGPGGVPVPGGFVGGQGYNRATLAWLNPVSGGVWSQSANWDGGVVADGVGAVPLFGNFDVTADNTVTLNSARTLSGLIFGDTVPASAANWTLSDGGNGANLLTLDTIVGVPTVTVNALGTNATASLAVTLAGTKGFAKAGAGTLVLTQPTATTGLVNVTGGTLRLPAGGSAAATTIAVSSGATLDVAGGNLTASAATTITGGGSLIINNGAGTFAAVATSNNPNGLIKVNGGTFTATSIGLPRSSDGTPSFAFGFVVTGGSALVNGAVGVGTNNSWGSMSIEGGATEITGALTIGNQTSGSRGGQLRVTGGSLTVTNAADGIILSRKAPNVANASFLGGVTTTERFKLGYDAAVNSGSANLTINGGTVYVGAGGIERSGSGTFTSAINLQAGTLGAKASWSSAAPMNLTGNIALQAADGTGTPADITLSGVLSGAGGLTKTGAGTLVLAGANTYTGVTTVSAGTLRVDGSLAAASGVVVNGPAILAGTGSINGPVTVAATGRLDFGGTPGEAVLNASSVTWAEGGSVGVRLGSSGVSDRLAVTGALAKSGSGSVVVAFQPQATLVAGSTYTLATFASTTFAAGDFIASGLPDGYAAEFTLTSDSLQVKIIGRPVITSASSATATVGAPFSYAITAANEPTGFQATNLPDGLEVDAVNGIVSGTPLQAGTFAVALGATNDAGTGTATLTLDVAKATGAIALTGLQQAYDGTPRPVTATTLPAGFDVDLTYDGSSTPPTLPGSYAVVATINDPDFTGTASGTLTVTITGLVRHAPTLNGDVDGSLQVLLPENVTLNGGAIVAGDLLLPGSPATRLNGNAQLGATRDEAGAASPSSHTVTLNGNALLSRLVRRVDPLALPVVAAPPSPTGTRSVSLNNASQSPGDFATLRNLTLNSNVGTVTIPPGTYGNFIANSRSGFVLGVAGSVQPSIYHFQNLTLNSNASLEVVGPVVIVLNGGMSTNASIGSAAHPEWLGVQIAGGGLSLASNVTVYAVVVAPSGTVTLNGNAHLVGRVVADRLIVNGNAVLADPE